MQPLRVERHHDAHKEFAEEDQDRVSGSVKGSRSRVAVKRVE